MNETPTHADPRRVLLTGATGYVGGRLLDALRERGTFVRCIVRDRQRMADQADERVAIVEGDVLKPDTLPAAMAGIDTAYYMIHALGSGDGKGFEAEEQRGARAFAQAAQAAGVRRIVYLGGLGDNPDSSPHLRSRRRVGELLADAVPTIEFRASAIIGSGSLSFELVRALARKLPVMIVPRWTQTETQPIAIEDVVDYLIAALDLPGDASRVYEIGTPDRTTYAGLMREYSRQRNLRRLMIPAPVISPRLSSLWLGLVTPIYARIGRKLIDSTQTSMVVNDDAALRDFAIKPRTVSEAIARALVREDQQIARTRWNDALSSGTRPPSFGGVALGSRLVDSRKAAVNAPAAQAFAPIRRIGGRTGWYYANALWRIRGAMDLLVGGVGMRRGRRDPEQLSVGDTLDFWRVEEYEPDRLLRLRAEMKLPGRAWLQFEVEPDGDRASVRQTAIFDPVGLSGLLYWYSIWPLHGLIFGNMLRAIVRRGEAEPTG